MFCDIFIDGRLPFMNTRIHSSLPEDYEIDEDFTDISVRHIVGRRGTELAAELFHQLSSDKGQVFIDNLRTKESVLVICEVREPSGHFDFVRIVLSGKGLLRQGIRNENVVSETTVSCLFTACVCLIHETITNLLILFVSIREV